MNKQLLQTYKNLSGTAQAELRHKYKDSPLGLRFIEFLAQNNKTDFKTSEAVVFLYGEKPAGEYATLENRFFKLRKKIYDELQGKTDGSSALELPEEEAELNRCKQMIATGNKKEAYKELVKLEKLCWERNLFELLPAVLDNMIFCNQVVNDVEKKQSALPLAERSHRTEL